MLFPLLSQADHHTSTGCSEPERRQLWSGEEPRPSKSVSPHRLRHGRTPPRGEQALANGDRVEYSVLTKGKGPKPKILYEMYFNVELSVDEVYCTNASLLLTKIMLCSELDYQKVLD